MSLCVSKDRLFKEKRGIIERYSLPRDFIRVKTSCIWSYQVEPARRGVRCPIGILGRLINHVTPRDPLVTPAISYHASLCSLAYLPQMESLDILWEPQKMMFMITDLHIYERFLSGLSTFILHLEKGAERGNNSYILFHSELMITQIEIFLPFWSMLVCLSIWLWTVCPIFLLSWTWFLVWLNPAELCQVNSNCIQP